MWKPLAISALISLGGASQVMALESIHIDTDNCESTLDYTVKVGSDFFEIHEDSDKQQLVSFHSPAQLIVNGDMITLDDQQQELLQEYRQKLHAAGRDTLLVTLEAVDIAMDGLSIAISALAGPDHPENQELKQFSADLIQRTEDRLNREGEIYYLGDTEIGNFIDETISEEFEPRIERLAKDAAGTIAWHALKAAFTGGQSIEERVTEEAEELLEQRAEQIEHTAEQLCASLQSIDRLESKIHLTVPALGDYDLVKIK
ncbi:DUF2884 family protein [Microbulbifer sp. CnH-101-E]|uniref:DUF2884 family protein n=1 Tax=unclassified Microbulbifer TaxID=2619833 RepID=UPI00403A513A